MIPNNELNIKYSAKFKDSQESELFDVWNLVLEKSQKINILDLETGKTMLVDLDYVNRYGVLQ